MIEPISNQQMLAKMESLRLGASSSPSNSIKQNNASFGKLFSAAIKATNNDQINASDLSKRFVSGEQGISSADVMRSNAQAEISMEATKQVRNKILEHYKDILNTQL